MTVLEPVLQARPLSPYVGLVPYEEGDAAFFFGRSTEAAIVAMNLRTSRLTILYGPSGVGKSSLLMAGAVHDLREEARDASTETPFAVCVFRSWRDDPVRGVEEAAREALAGLEPLPPPGETLAATLREWTSVAGTLLLVFDQFEEYFQYHPDEGDDEQLTGFASELARIVNDASLRVHVLLGIREDAWAKLDLFEGHVPSLFANYVRVDHLDRESAREAIEGPVEAWNRTLAADEPMYQIEPELVEAVLAATSGGRLTLTADGDRPSEETGGDRVEAPFLQLVLDRLWRETVAAGDRTLTLARLEELGGASRIVENHLLDALGRLGPAEQDAASDCFRFLVSRSGTKIAHSASDLAEWTGRGEPEIAPVLDRLCTGESGRILRAIAAAEDGGSASYELYHDILAEPIVAWRKEHERRREQEAEARRQRAARRRLVRVVAGLAVLVLAFAAFAAWALHERSVAAKRTKVARSQALAAQATQALADRPAVALGDSIEAVEKSPTPQAETALRDALVNSHVRFVLPLANRNAKAAALRVVGPGHRGGVPATQLAFDRGGDLLLTLGADGLAHLWKTSTGREVGDLTVPGARVLAAAFGPHGPVALTVVHGRPPALTTLQPPRKTVVLAGETKAPASAVFSPDGRRLVTFGGGHVVRVFDALTGVRLAALPVHPTDASFSGDGRFLVTAGDHVRVWRVADWKRVALLGTAAHAALSPRGRLVLTAGADGTARIWRTKGGTLAAVLPGSGTPFRVTDLSAFSPTGAFSTDGQLVATTNFDGTVRVWEVASGKALGSVDAGYANTVVFSPDRRMLASATWDGDVVAAQASPGFAIATGFGPPSANGGRHGFDPVLSPNGRFLVAATGDGAALWRTDGTEVARMPAHGLTVSTAAFSADSSLVGTSLGFGPAVFQPMPPFVTTVRRTSDGSRVAVIPGAADALAFSRDRRLLVAHGLYGTGHVWRVSPAAPIPALKGTVALDAGAQRAVVGDAAGLRVVHVPDGRLISKLAGARFLASAAFSPDGTRVVGAFQGHPLRVWDTATGRLVATLGPSLASSSPRFSTDGRLVFASSDSGFSVWRTSDWKVVVTRPASAPAAVSSDGAFAAIPEEGGRLAIVALRSGITTEVQTPTVAALIGATFGVGSRLVAARDANGNVQVVACEPCRSEGSLMSLARDRLAHLGGFHPRSPVVGMISVA